MKLTNKQTEALNIIKEEKSISKDDSRVHKNTMNSLYFKGLIELRRFANGEFWEMGSKSI